MRADQAQFVDAPYPPTPASRPDGEPDGEGTSGPGVSYIDLIRHWWWLALITLLIGTAGALAYLRFGPVPHESTALILVPQQTDPADPTANSGQVRTAASNFAAEANSPLIHARVSEKLQDTHPISTRELLLMTQDGSIQTRWQRESNLITITVTDTDPAFAQLLADTLAQVFVDEINTRTTAQLDTRKQQIEQQIEATRTRLEAAQLQQRERDLSKELTQQQNQLLQLQLQYQQELQRQIEMDYRLSTIGPSSQGAQDSKRLTESYDQVRTTWLQVVSNQQKQVEQSIADLTTELDDVRSALSKLPTPADPSVASAFASAYADQLQNLTQAYVRLQLNAAAATNPLVRSGAASESVPSISAKKTLITGSGAGLALGAGLAYLLELLRLRRSARRRAAGAPADRANEPADHALAGALQEPVAHAIAPAQRVWPPLERLGLRAKEEPYDPREQASNDPVW